MSALQLRPTNADVFAVHSADGAHVGNLKRVGAVWKFKAVGYEPDGSVVPGGGPLTGRHNTVFTAPDPDAVNAALGSA
ncbi:MAG: hypothetical protein E6Q78_07400 [Rhodoferax sp.]|nr:MAG: hypothetical protein E6Q78_07400 [Rhodoferax sp.]